MHDNTHMDTLGNSTNRNILIMKKESFISSTSGSTMSFPTSAINSSHSSHAHSGYAHQTNSSHSDSTLSGLAHSGLMHTRSARQAQPVVSDSEPSNFRYVDPSQSGQVNCDLIHSGSNPTPSTLQVIDAENGDAASPGTKPRLKLSDHNFLHLLAIFVGCMTFNMTSAFTSGALGHRLGRYKHDTVIKY